MVAMLSDYLDNELDETVCKEIKRHARSCPRCHTFMRTLQRTIDLCKHLETRPLPEALAEKIKMKIRETSGVG